ncbi:hypothetical protein KEM52_000933 [Ascosphaera acerosa]|nr:hypothetical protein KEM52_000933 [Ascosphaera acerosa]
MPTTVRTPVTIEPLTEADLSRLHEVEVRAFGPQVAMRLTQQATPEWAEFRQKIFREALADARKRCFKACTSDGTACGFAIWLFVPDPEAEAADRKRKEEEKERKKGTPDEEPAYPPGANPAAFEAFFMGIVHQQGQLAVGQKRAELRLLVVDPEYQGQGIGSTLVRHGAKIAESMGLPFVWLEATSEGHPVYLKLGFEDKDVRSFDWTPFGEECIDYSYGMKCILPMKGTGEGRDQEHV